MSSSSLLLGLQRSSVKLQPSSSSLLPSLSLRMYSTGSNEDIVKKARSTAEEFIRQAKEKTGSVRDTADEVVEDVKEAVVTGESKTEKDKFKEKVEKGNYDNIGRD